MENNDNWVDDRLNALAPPSAWKPDANAALAKVQHRDRLHRKHRAQWAGTAMAASIFALAILLTPAKCAFGVCKTPTLPPVAVQAVPLPVPVTPAPRHIAAAPAPTPTPAPPPQRSYKESGNPDAAITVELFTDYECPHCATVFDQVLPMLFAEYVATGKIKFVHRDFPLPLHKYARLAARYANAAGELGQYDIVVNQIFRTQPIWSRSGDIDSQVAQVLSNDTMEKVRDLVQNDGHLDDTVNTDLMLVRQDGLNQTPSFVVTRDGKRQVIAPVPSYNFLKSYLDELMTK